MERIGSCMDVQHTSFTPMYIQYITLLSCSSRSLSNMAVQKHTDTVEPPLMTFLTFLHSRFRCTKQVL